MYAFVIEFKLISLCTSKMLDYVIMVSCIIYVFYLNCCLHIVIASQRKTKIVNNQEATIWVILGKV